MYPDSARPYTVQYLPGLADQLDLMFAPGDASEACTSVCEDLPVLHSRLPRKQSHFHGELPYYFARYSWFNLGFTYVELGTILLVVELWEDQWWNQGRQVEVDCVLGDWPSVRRAQAFHGPSFIVEGR